uniref:Methyltransferase n=1 Tax=Fusarium oxysporum (strain Fo5176) TaxID=660025 RepID=A0A0D2YHU1_FUSOF
MTPRDPMPTTNTNDSPNGPRDSLSDYEFSFETYLDYKSRIEIDLRSLDSLYGRDTASVAESIYEFHKENGRTYHAYRAGWSGCWAIDMGDEFPEARIIGTDLSPIQTNLVPPNVEFIIDDATDEWPQGRDWCNFDLIHTRATLGCWSDMKTQIIEPAFERLKPGGWLECQELMGLLESDDDSLTDKNPFKVWCDNIVEASILANRPLNFAASMKQWFIEAGFVDVTEKVYKLPLNGWPKDRRLKRFGELWHANMVNLVDVRKALADQRMHSYEKFYVVYGRKPETA